MAGEITFAAAAPKHAEENKRQNENNDDTRDDQHQGFGVHLLKLLHAYRSLPAQAAWRP